MVKCAFCGKEEHAFMGVNFIRNDGIVDYFCSSKCRKNANKLHRDKRKMKWTEAYRVALNKTIVKAKNAKDKQDAKDASDKLSAGKEEVKSEKKAKG